ncbi:MAG: peroxidase [Euryarchaeota archaeon]|nr:peroxidase [Euryarchaeota archaeon]
MTDFNSESRSSFFSNSSALVYLVILLFFTSSFAGVSAAPIEKEGNSTPYVILDEQPIGTSSQYSINGSGLNSENPDWGAANTQMSRQSPRYPSPDGNNLTFWDRTDVPNPREVSNAVCHESIEHPDSRNLSDYVWLWGQFATHEMDHTTTQDGRTHDQLQPDTAHIPVHENDTWMGFPGGLYMRFFRSVIVNGSDNPDPLIQREHPNTITSWLDGSVVYGSDDARGDWLREYNGGRMKISDYPEGDLLPQANYANDPTTPGMSFAGFNFTDSFVAGDGRANEHVALLAMHILFVREHNRLADEIAERNPGWSDEEIFQYARHINIGLIQTITYYEFLPSLGIDLEPYLEYNSSINPTISNEFSVVAFRMGHSQIGSAMLRMDGDRNPIEQGHLTLREGFFDVTPITEEGGIGPILRGLAYNIEPENDIYYSDDLRNQMFGPPGSGGLDLCAIDIQRGRDHGIPDFNTVRESYGLERYSNWSDITSDIEVQEKLNSTYPDIDSVDALIGMFAEDHVENSALGETMHHIIKDQFTRLRDGDRLHFESDNSEIYELRSEIENTTLADIILRNTEIEHIQCDVFYAEQELDQMDCTHLNKEISNNIEPNSSDISMIFVLTLFFVLTLVLVVMLKVTKTENNINLEEEE